MAGPSVGELCAGYGGLAMAVTAVFGGELAWVADNDPGAVAILAHRFPQVPNLGDITVIDWARVPPVDIVTAGFPCQDVSCAGARRGLRAGSRTGVWVNVAIAIAALRPGLVVLENVGGLLSFAADGNVEPCPWCLGDTADEHVLRALGAVLADLAETGFDAEWCSLRASDVGAPHRRERVFILGWPAADTGGGDLQRRRGSGVLAGAAGAAAGQGLQRERDGHAADGGGAVAADSDGAAGGQWGQSATGQAKGGWAWADTGRRSGASAADSAGTRRAAGENAGAGNGGEGAGCTAAGRRTAGGAESERGRGARAAAWGQFGPAIARWEAILGRPAPRPTEPGRTGERLAPRFVEWLQGLPPGWVTDVPGLSRNAHLKALGNGVVPQQATAALLLLLDRAATPEAA